MGITKDGIVTFQQLFLIRYSEKKTMNSFQKLSSEFYETNNSACSKSEIRYLKHLICLK